MRKTRDNFSKRRLFVLVTTMTIISKESVILSSNYLSISSLERSVLPGNFSRITKNSKRRRRMRKRNEKNVKSLTRTT